MVKSIKESRIIAAEQLNKLVEEAGSQAQLARMLSSSGDYNITPQGVLRWFNFGQISKQGALAVIKHPTAFKSFNLSQLRPDVPLSEWGE